jgi:hypothetical protein
MMPQMDSDQTKRKFVRHFSPLTAPLGQMDFQQNSQQQTPCINFQLPQGNKRRKNSESLQRRRTV